jgi:hypothetical protein
MGVAQIEVFPDDGKWRWRERGADGKLGDPSGAYNRSETIEKARRAAGATRVELFDADGNEVGFVRQTGKRVVLLSQDGSEYGELDAAPPQEGGTRKVVTVQGVGTTDEAGEA